MLKQKLKLLILLAFIWSAQGFAPVESQHAIENSPENAPKSSALICHIEGKAQLTASHFQLAVYGPNDKKELVKTRILDYRHVVKINNLSEGTYWIFVEKRVDTGVKVTPSKLKISLKQGETYEFNVKLR